MGEVEQRGSAELVVVPMGDVEGEVVVDEDAESVGLLVGVEGPLKLTVTIIYDI